jgi:hypothetical protein
MAALTAREGQLAANYLLALRRLTTQTKLHADVLYELCKESYAPPRGLSRIYYRCACIEGIERLCEQLDEGLGEIAKNYPPPIMMDDTTTFRDPLNLSNCFNKGLKRLNNFRIFHDRWVDITYKLFEDPLSNEKLWDPETTANIHGYSMARAFLSQAAENLRNGSPLSESLEKIRNPKQRALLSVSVLKDILQDGKEAEQYLQDRTDVPDEERSP